jgi:hypothetical protein
MIVSQGRWRIMREPAVRIPDAQRQGVDLQILLSAVRDAAWRTQRLLDAARSWHHVGA